jgi:single-stranded-DNA-specific exonuclease
LDYRKKKEKWFVAAKRADFQAIAEKYGIDPVLARIIRNRDVVGDEAMEEYLHGSMKSLHDPRLLLGCSEAALLLQQKIQEGKKIRIIGDYDIDGVNATCILYKAIRRCGGNVDFEIPDRMKDGYGLNIHLIELAVEEGIDTVITCDNGIAAIDEVAYAKEKGLTMIVTDHHEPLFEDRDGTRIFHLPQADVLVNPKQPDCPYPYKKLCGGAVAWKVACELYRICSIPASEADPLLAFAAFATIGDVMDLDGENRVLVKAGLYRLHHTDNQGLLALARVNNLDIRTITSYHIGFVLGPCINASGRLDTAKRSMRLLLAETEEEAMQLAEQLKALNEERKQMTTQAVEEACRRIDEQKGEVDRVLVVYLPHCHESIAGIVAGRLRERYYRPSFVVTDGETSAKGSGRSIEGYSMFEEMVKCGDLFLKFGGHPMAAGFSLEKERIDEMRRRLNENCTLTEEDLKEKVSIDVPMPIDYITEDLVEQLSLLEPFGKGNEKPLFAEAKLKALSARVLGKSQNVMKLRVMNHAGTVMDALYFGDPDGVRDYLTQKYGSARVQDLFWGRGEGLEMDLTYYPSVNEYMGQKSLQIVIKNYR